MLSEDGQWSQVKAVEQMLHIESSEQINDTLTNGELKTAGENFMYLNMCQHLVKPWLLFYKELFQTQSPGQIILTLNRVMKGQRPQTNEYFIKIVEKLLERILSMLPGRDANNTVSSTEARQSTKEEGN